MLRGSRFHSAMELLSFIETTRTQFLTLNLGKPNKPVLLALTTIGFSASVKAPLTVAWLFHHGAAPHQYHRGCRNRHDQATFLSLR